MRAIFGVLSLLIVLAIVGSLAKKQLQALGVGGVATRGDAVVAVPGAMPGAMAADAGGLTLPQQSKALQDKVHDDTVRALQQGVDRNQRADPN